MWSLILEALPNAIKCKAFAKQSIIHYLTCSGPFGNPYPGNVIMVYNEGQYI